MFARGRHRFRHVGSQHVGRRVPHKRRLAGDKKIEQSAEPVDVSPAVDFTAAESPFGGGILWRAGDEPVGSRGMARGAGGFPDRTEIEQLRHVAAAAEDRHEDIRGAQIAMDEPQTVGLGQGTAHLAAEVHRTGAGHRPGVVHDVGGAAAGEILHREIGAAVGGAPGIEHSHRVGMQKLRGRPRLPLEPGGHVRAAVVDDLQAALPLEELMLRQVDLAGAPFVELADQAVGPHAIGRVVVCVLVCVAAPQHPGGERRQGHAHDQEEGIRHDDLVVGDVVHVEMGRVGMVENDPVAEDQSGRHRHHSPGRRGRVAGHEDAPADHQHERPDHAIFLDGDGIDQVMLIDEVHAREILGGQQGQHLKAEQKQLQGPHLPPGEPRRIPEEDEHEPRHDRPQQKRPRWGVGDRGGPGRGPGHLDHDEQQVEQGQESGDGGKARPQPRCRRGVLPGASKPFSRLEVDVEVG